MSLDAVLRVMSRKQILSIFEATSRISVWHGAVSSGKTVASLLAFLHAVVNAPENGLIFIVARTLDTAARNIMDPLMQPFGPFGPFAPYIRHTRGATTATIFGRTVHLIGANDVKAEGRIRGSTAALIYVDEASLIPEGFWTMALSRIRVPGARLLATTNPDSTSHWLRKKFLLRQHELNLRHWHFTLDDNPSLTTEYVDALKREYVGLWYRRFVLGEWCLAEGAVFDMFDETVHVVDELPMMRRWLAVGIDHGTRNPFHAVLLGLGVDGRLYICAEWRWDSTVRRRQMSPAEYSREVRTWLTTVPIPGAGRDLRGVQPEMLVVDPSAIELRVQMYQDGHTPRLADNEVLPGIQTLSTLFALDLLRVHRSCQGLLDELPAYSWDDDKAEKGIDEPVKVDDHGIDALRYAVRTSRALWLPQLREKLTLAT